MLSDEDLRIVCQPNVLGFTVVESDDGTLHLSSITVLLPNESSR